jgi:hypothetical protein
MRGKMKKGLIAVFIALLPSMVYSASDCSEKPECWPEGSTRRISLEYRDAAEKQARRIFEESEAIVDLLSDLMPEGSYEMKKITKAVPKHTKLQVEYIESECDIAAFAMEGGSGMGTNKKYQLCRLNQLDTYRRILLNARKCLSRARESSYTGIAAAKCLYQIAPSTYGD